MKYEITIEQTFRVTTEFEAANKDEAIRRANEMYENAQKNPEQVESEYVQSDFSLSDANGNTIVEWAD